MKTHRSTQLFLYCSGGERSVKCVCPALEVEASKEEQRGVVRFLMAEGAGTREIRSRMSADAYHCKTIRARYRFIEPLRPSLSDVFHF